MYLLTSLSLHASKFTCFWTMVHMYIYAHVFSQSLTSGISPAWCHMYVLEGTCTIFTTSDHHSIYPVYYKHTTLTACHEGPCVVNSAKSEQSLHERGLIMRPALISSHGQSERDIWQTCSPNIPGPRYSLPHKTSSNANVSGPTNRAIYTYNKQLPNSTSTYQRLRTINISGSGHSTTTASAYCNHHTLLWHPRA